MKKLKLNLDGIAHPLSIAQMKKIYGGNQSCTLACCNEVGYLGVTTLGNCPGQSQEDEACLSVYGDFGNGAARLCSTDEYNGNQPCTCSNY